MPGEDDPYAPSAGLAAAAASAGARTSQPAAAAAPMFGTEPQPAPQPAAMMPPPPGQALMAPPPIANGEMPPGVGGQPQPQPEPMPEPPAMPAGVPMPGLLPPPPPPASADQTLSEDARTNAILHKLAHERVLETADLSHLTVYLSFEGTTRPLRVLNPTVFRRRVCVVHRFEVMHALGLMGGLQERFLQPLRLVPADLTKPVLNFEASTLHGEDIVLAERLQNGASYQVEMVDTREDALAALTDEQMEELHANYERYDTDGDGCISIDEFSAEVSRKNQLRRQALFQQFDAYVAENPAGRAAAEETLQANLHKLTEAEETLFTLFSKSDVDGNGSLSFKEYALAEAAFLQSGVNPERVHMF